MGKIPELETTEWVEYAVSLLPLHAKSPGRVARAMLPTMPSRELQRHAERIRRAARSLGILQPRTARGETPEPAAVDLRLASPPTGQRARPNEPRLPRARAARQTTVSNAPPAELDPAAMSEIAYYEREVRELHRTIEGLRAFGTERASQMGVLLNAMANARKSLDEARNRAKSELEATSISGMRDPAQLLGKLAEYSATLQAVCPEAVAALVAALVAATPGADRLTKPVENDKLVTS